MKDRFFLPALREERLLLSMQMVADALEEELETCLACGIDETPFLTGVQVYTPGLHLSPDVLYYVPEEGETHFPVDDYAYVSRMPLAGKAPHLICPGAGAAELINLLVRVFARYHDFEAALNALVAKGSGLDEICQLGFSFFQNPMYIHDQYFSVLSHPYWLQGMLQMEYNEETGTYNIPLSLIEDFRFNQQYLETMERREAAIWGVDQYPLGMRTLYVNLFDAEEYVGRLLINELNTPLQRGQFKVAEYLGRRIEYALRHRQTGSGDFRSREETMRLFLESNKVSKADLAALRTSLGWAGTDTFLCLSLASQTETLPDFSDGVLRSRISTVLGSCISFRHHQQMHFVINLTAVTCRTGDVRHRISALVRDSLMRCGMSHPVSGFEQLPVAYRQAEAALSYCIRWKDARWILSFEECALAYMTDHLQSELSWRDLASSKLQAVRAHDERYGTEYYQTLKAYLTQERSIPRASAQLIIHRTTLQYRVERMRELFGLSLEDPGERLYLLVSFHLLEQET